jgi:alanyl-tRNA synthetase
VAERLYYDAPTLEFTARVADIRLESRAGGEALWQVALDRTAFYPEGGGQPWDTGVLVATAKSGAVLEVAVERVEEDEAGEVWHAVRKPLVEGTEIVGRVDAERRMDHAQQHSGQHLLSAVFLRELGAKTVGFRLGAEVVTIDLAVEKLGDEEIARVEAAANRVVYEDRALRAGWVSREEAEAMLARGDLRKLPERAGPMRIVEMEGVEFNACGGTHVASTGAIGGILVRRVEKVKQGQRVEFVCGLRAVRAARVDYERLSGVAKMLSVGAGDVAGRVDRLIEDKKAATKEIKALEKQLKQQQDSAKTLTAPADASTVKL